MKINGNGDLHFHWFPLIPQWNVEQDASRSMPGSDLQVVPTFFWRRIFSFGLFKKDREAILIRSFLQSFTIGVTVRNFYWKSNKSKRECRQGWILVLFAVEAHIWSVSGRLSRLCYKYWKKYWGIGARRSLSWLALAAWAPAPCKVQVMSILSSLE